MPFIEVAPLFLSGSRHQQRPSIAALKFFIPVALALFLSSSIDGLTQEIPGTQVTQAQKA